MSEQQIGQYTIKQPVIMVYPKLLTPEAYENKPDAKKYFSAAFMFKPDSAELKAIKTIAAQVARAKWPSRAFNSIRWPFKNGDELADARKAKSGVDDGFTRGFVVINTKSKNRPTLSAKVDGKLYE